MQPGEKRNSITPPPTTPVEDLMLRAYTDAMATLDELRRLLGESFEDTKKRRVILHAISSACDAVRVTANACARAIGVDE